MPKTSTIKGLKEICLLSIAKNMERLWCADYSSKLLDQGTFMYLIGPFDNLSMCSCSCVFIFVQLCGRLH